MAKKNKKRQTIATSVKIQAEADFVNITFYRNVFAAALVLVSVLMLFADSSKLGRNDISTQNTEGVGTGQRVGFSYELNAKNEFDTALIRPQKAGTFNLVAGKNYLINVRSFVNSDYYNKDIDFSVSIVRKSDKMVVSDIDIAFFIESGTDDEGNWREKLLEDELKFHVDESGVYEVFVSPDYEDITNITQCTLTVAITETGYYYYYWLVFGGFGSAFLICQWQRERFVAAAKLPHSTLLHDFLNLRAHGF